MYNHSHHNKINGKLKTFSILFDFVKSSPPSQNGLITYSLANVNLNIKGNTPTLMADLT